MHGRHSGRRARARLCLAHTNGAIVERGAIELRTGSPGGILGRHRHKSETPGLASLTILTDGSLGHHAECATEEGHLIAGGRVRQIPNVDAGSHASSFFLEVALRPEATAYRQQVRSVCAPPGERLGKSVERGVAKPGAARTLRGRNQPYAQYTTYRHACVPCVEPAWDGQPVANAAGG
jgi:hypothetical protein